MKVAIDKVCEEEDAILVDEYVRVSVFSAESAEVFVQTKKEHAEIE